MTSKTSYARKDYTTSKLARPYRIIIHTPDVRGVTVIWIIRRHQEADKVEEHPWDAQKDDSHELRPGRIKATLQKDAVDPLPQRVKGGCGCERVAINAGHTFVAVLSKHPFIAIYSGGFDSLRRIRERLARPRPFQGGGLFAACRWRKRRGCGRSR
jgi:hypothetical protein